MHVKESADEESSDDKSDRSSTPKSPEITVTTEVSEFAHTDSTVWCIDRVTELAGKQSDVREAVTVDEQLPDLTDVSHEYGWKAQVSGDPLHLK